MVLQQHPDGRIDVGFTADTMETKHQIEMIASLAIRIEPDAIAKLLQQYNHLDAIGPIYDPTAYGRILNTKGGHERLAVAFSRFRGELQKIMDGGR